jgi:hypothetical protein
MRGSYMRVSMGMQTKADAKEHEAQIGVDLSFDHGEKGRLMAQFLLVTALVLSFSVPALAAKRHTIVRLLMTVGL